MTTYYSIETSGGGIVVERIDSRGDALEAAWAAAEARGEDVVLATYGGGEEPVEVETVYAPTPENIARAASLLGATKIAGTDEWRYRAYETGTDWAVETQDLVRVLDFVAPDERVIDNAAYTAWVDVAPARELRDQVL